MSFNRTIYDDCAYKNRLSRNVSILDHVLNNEPYHNDKSCRHMLGFVGGNNVSHIAGNMVDLESDLRGQTRFLSKCCNAYTPSSDGYIHNDTTKPIDTTMKHLNACQSITYRSIPAPSYDMNSRTHCY